MCFYWRFKFLEKDKQFGWFTSVVAWLEEHLLCNDLLIFFLLEMQKVVTKTNSDYYFWTVLWVVNVEKQFQKILTENSKLFGQNSSIWCLWKCQVMNFRLKNIKRDHFFIFVIKNYTYWKSILLGYFVKITTRSTNY